MTQYVRYLALLSVCACASVSATQIFELTTDTVTMPILPSGVAPGEPQTLSLTASFGACSDSAVVNLDDARANDHVDSLDAWVIVNDITLRTDTTFAGIDNLNLQLVARDEVIPVCDRNLTASEQQSPTVRCAFEYRVRAEDLCEKFGSASAPSQMTIQVTVRADDVTLTTISATIQMVAELDADVSL